MTKQNKKKNDEEKMNKSRLSYVTEDSNIT